MLSPPPLFLEIERRAKLLKKSVKAVSREAGLDETYLYKLRDGSNASPGLKALQAIAGVLGCTVHDLTGNPDEFDIDAARTMPEEPRRRNTDGQGEAMTVKELDVRASAGPGAFDDMTEQVVGEWRLPKVVLGAHTTARAERIRVITVYGTSMVPDFSPGDRVMVDTEDRMPSPSGAFVIWDGVGNIIKLVEVVPYSDPPRVQLISRDPALPVREFPLEQVVIQGRVFGKLAWT